MDRVETRGVGSGSVWFRVVSNLTRLKRNELDTSVTSELWSSGIFFLGSYSLVFSVSLLILSQVERPSYRLLFPGFGLSLLGTDKRTPRDTYKESP